MTPQVREPITEPFARIDGLPVAVAIVNDYLGLAADFAAAFPGIRLVIYSGIRTYEDQVRIFKERYTTNPAGRRVYDVRRWQGVLWYRISPVGTVAQPGSSNHESGRALDLRDTGSDPGVASSFLTPRNIWLSRNCGRFGFTHTGRNFAEPWHVEHLRCPDPWGGLGKPLSILSSNPGQALTTSSSGGGGSSTTSGGGSSTAPIIQSEEDDMRLIRITDGSRKGRHYAIAPEYIKQITTSESVKAVEDAFGITEKPVSEWTFKRILGTYGIPSDVVDARGYIRNDLENGGHQSGGTWSRAQRAERKGYEAVKAAQKR